MAVLLTESGGVVLDPPADVGFVVGRTASCAALEETPPATSSADLIGVPLSTDWRGWPQEPPRQEPAPTETVPAETVPAETVPESSPRQLAPLLHESWPSTSRRAGRDPLPGRKCKATPRFFAATSCDRA
jgi:hypothetical protein